MSTRVESWNEARAALLRTVLGTADLHKVDERPLPPLEVADLLSEKAAPAIAELIHQARVDVLLDAAHGISLITAPYLDRNAVIRVLEQWSADPDRLVPRPATQEPPCSEEDCRPGRGGLHDVKRVSRDV